MKVWTRPSPALVISIVALVVAMAGTGYAAATLPKNSVGSKQIKKNAVTGAKVKNGSLGASDFKAGQLPAGPAGPTGPLGPKGEPGAPGAPGPFPDTLPAGKTLKGTYAIGGGSFTGPSGSLGNDAISFVYPLATAPTAVVVPKPPAANPDATHCPGTGNDPQAASGFVCIYETFNVHAGILNAYNPETGASGADRQGVEVEADSNAAGVLDDLGTWAVTGN